MIYEAALDCVQNSDLKDEWTKYLEETRNHVEVLTEVCASLNLDTEHETPVRLIMRKLGVALVDAMDTALASAPPADAELVACECVVIAETKDHLNWELLSKVVAEGGAAPALEDACGEIEDQEDEHLYHTKGWCRELWLQALGLPAVLPPPEEQKNVTTAIGAARAEQQRDEMLVSARAGRDS